MSELRHIGDSIGRREGIQKVTGRAAYTADIELPGMLVGKLLKSPLAHARILNIDTSRAKAVNGVKSVIHGRDFVGSKFGPAILDETLFPSDVVRYVGQPVVAVAATDADTANEALSLIRVEYEPLSPVLDPLLALEENSPPIHPDLADYGTVYPNPIKYGNVAMYSKGAIGNVDEGLERADRVYEHTFTTPATYPAPLEPHAAIAQFDGERATVWATTQQPFPVRAALAGIFDARLDDIRVIVPELGGGFGGKEFMKIEPFAYLLARESGKPVKIVLTREEEFSVTSPRHASHIELTTGVKCDGSLMALRARIVYDTGAFAGQGPFVTACGLVACFGTYRIPNVEGEAYCVYTNKPNAASYRGYGFPQATFAVEAQMDLIAKDLGVDPVEIRLKNLVSENDLAITGQPLRAVAARESLEAVVESASWVKKRTHNKPWHGIGVACGSKAGGIGASSATVTINEDGTVRVTSGIVDLGTGIRSVLAQIVSEVLTVAVDDVSVLTADTAISAFDFGSVASRGAYCAGKAAYRAAENAKHKLAELAASQLEIAPEDLVLEDGRIHVVGHASAGFDMGEIGALSHYATGGPIFGSGSFIGGMDQSMQPEVLEGFPLGILPHWSYGSHIAEVEVDPDTGEVAILRLYSAHDVGRTLNRLNVTGQLEGGLVMGMSAALFEHAVFAGDGSIQNDTFVDFKLPTAMDVPELNSTIIEHSDPEGPFGAKGIGEVVSIPTAPAIANAVYDATGVMVRDLPITPEKILKGLAKIAHDAK